MKTNMMNSYKLETNKELTPMQKAAAAVSHLAAFGMFALVMLKTGGTVMIPAGAVEAMAAVMMGADYLHRRGEDDRLARISLGLSGLMTLTALLHLFT